MKDIMGRRSKLRVLFYTDPHHSDTAPMMRQETYRTDILNKEEQILKAAKKCDGVIIGGDIFHQKKADKVSHKLVNLVGEVYREFPQTFIFPGNHDFENNIDEVFGLRKSPLATLSLLPNVKILHEDFGKINQCVFIFGVGGGDDYMNQLETMSSNYFSKEGDHAQFHIGVFHASVANKKFPFDTIKPNRLVRFFNLMCLGHLHTYQEVTNKIVAPGSLSRGVLRLDESYDRKVGYAIIDIVSGEVQTKFVPIDVRPPDEVFKVNKREQKRLEETAVGNLLDFIHSLEVPRVMSATKLMEHIKDMSLEYDIERRALEILRSL